MKIEHTHKKHQTQNCELHDDVGSATNEDKLVFKLIRNNSYIIFYNLVMTKTYLQFRQDIRVPKRSNTKQAVQVQKMARDRKFWI